MSDIGRSYVTGNKVWISVWISIVKKGLRLARHSLFRLLLFKILCFIFFYLASFDIKLEKMSIYIEKITRVGFQDAKYRVFLCGAWYEESVVWGG